MIDGKEAQWTKLLQALVRIESVHEREHEAVELVETHLARLGIDYTSVPFDADLLARLPAAQRPISRVPGRRNLVARLPGKTGGRSLILNCHLDIVPAEDPSEWTHPPFAATIADGAIYAEGHTTTRPGR